MVMGYFPFLAGSMDKELSAVAAMSVVEIFD